MFYNTIKTNFHTHTIFCGHAKGLPVDYLDAIKELKLKTIGFSEHAYVGVPSFKHTIKTPEDMNKYYDEVIKLRNATDTEVLVGLEVDYFPRLNSYYKELKEKYLHSIDWAYLEKLPKTIDDKRQPNKVC